MTGPLANPERQRARASTWQALVRIAWKPALVLRPIRRRPWRSLGLAGLVALILAGSGSGAAWLWASHHLREARTSVEHYRNTEARDHLDVVLKVRPRDPEALLLAARTARRLGTYDQAGRLLADYEKVRGRDDTDLFLEQALLRVEQGEIDRLRGFCQSLITADHPSAPLALEAMTRTYLRQFRYTEASECVKRWLLHRPDDVLALYCRAFLDEQRNLQRDAVAGYRHVLEIDPDYDEARGRLIELLLELHSASEALGHVDHLRRRMPGDPLMNVFLARCEDQLGQRDEAERLLDAVLARHPHFGRALFERGQLAVRAGKSREAEKWLRAAVAQEPGDYKVRYQLYLCLRSNGNTTEAAAEQERLTKIRGDMERIQEIVNDLMQQRPHDPALHHEVALISLRAGAVDEGKRWLQSALREDPNYAPAHQTLAVVYERTGEPGLAAHHRRLAEASPAKGR